MRRFIFRLPRFAGKRRVGQYLLGGGRYPCEAILDVGATAVKDGCSFGGRGRDAFRWLPADDVSRDILPGHRSR